AADDADGRHHLPAGADGHPEPGADRGRTFRPKLAIISVESRRVSCRNPGVMQKGYSHPRYGLLVSPDAPAVPLRAHEGVEAPVRDLEIGHASRSRVGQMGGRIRLASTDGRVRGRAPGRRAA